MGGDRSSNSGRVYDRELAKVKSLYFRKIREFFDGRGFLEVEVPCMTPTVDPEPAMRHFETVFEDMYGGLANVVGRHSAGDKYPMYLVTSPEFQMKKLLGAGFGDIYTLARVFRNGEAGGGRHNTEFTMLEWYKVDAGYEEMMDETEKFVKWIAGQPGLENFPGSKNLSRDRNWSRKSLNDLFIEYCGINLNENRGVEQLKKTAREAGIARAKAGIQFKADIQSKAEMYNEMEDKFGENFYDTNGCETWDDVMYKIFLNHIEPKLGFEKPVFVYNYPASQAALAKKCERDPFWAERFELYINGNELCNGFSELTDSVEQKKRFEEQNIIRTEQGRTTFPVDEEFLTSLESLRLHCGKGCGGNALGTDRLLKVLLGKDKIEDVMLFPIEKMLGEQDV